MNIINKLYKIVNDIKNGKANAVSDTELNELLNHYCEGPIIEGEAVTHPYTDPLCAETLNQEYNKRTGVDHKNYIAHQLGIIKGLLEDKDNLLQARAYTPDYFTQIEAIKLRIERNGLTKADKLGNPVPADITTKTAYVSQKYVASLGDGAKGDKVIEGGTEK